jgi:hypothetical protein
MRIQCNDGVSFEAADNSAEEREARDLAAYHELLMRGGHYGQPGSDTYAALIGAALQFGPVNVVVTHALDGRALMQPNADGSRIYVNPGFSAIDATARIGAARKALIFEVGNVSQRSDFWWLEEAARRRDFSAYDQNLSATDLRILDGFNGDIQDQNHRNCVIYLREGERLEHYSGEHLLQVDAEMANNGLPRIGANVANYGVDFDPHLNYQIDTGHAFTCLPGYNELVNGSGLPILPNLSVRSSGLTSRANNRAEESVLAQPSDPTRAGGEYRHVGYLDNNEPVFAYVQNGLAARGQEVTSTGEPVPRGTRIHPLAPATPSRSATSPQRHPNSRRSHRNDDSAGRREGRSRRNRRSMRAR